MKSPLEDALDNVPAIVPQNEADIEILRNVLRGTEGTNNQRTALQRIIAENKNPESAKVLRTLSRKLGIPTT